MARYDRLTPAALLCVLALCGADAAGQDPGSAPPPVPPAVTPTAWRIVQPSWTAADERGYSEFVAAIGEAKCSTVKSCIEHPANPFAASNPPGVHWYADCADLPYFLRAYYAWKRGLPFAHVTAVSPRGRTRDIRYTALGNKPVERYDVTTGDDGLALLRRLRDRISSAMYRIHPDIEGPVMPDLYPVAIQPKSVRPGTVIYDPNGHLAVVYKVEEDGRIRYIDSHPDNSLTRGTYDRRFVRSSPGMGAGFKNWRPLTLEGAARRADGVYTGGYIVAASNAAIPDYSAEQFFGTGERPEDRDWASGPFAIGEEMLDYYDFVRTRMAGGSLVFEPVQELRNMVRSNCDDIRYRAEAVDLAVANGIQNKPQPARLPENIYGTEGEWETYSTPSRDARLKVAFQELRTQTQRFVELHRSGDPKVHYDGADLIGDLLRAYDEETAACSIVYAKSDGTPVTLAYEDVRRRLFALSFDPYHCIERRWGASDSAELASCRDDASKQAWYAAEQNLRNQLERTYDVPMGFTLAALQAAAPGSGVPAPPDIDVRAYLESQRAPVP